MDNHSSLASGWENVQEFSFPLAVFGAVLCTLQPVVCIGGSILLLLVIIKFPQLRHIPSNLLLASLAASDLLIGVLVQTGRAAMSVYVLTTSESGSLPNILQTGYFASFLLHSSVLTIAAITVDRYISITRSLRYHLIVTESRVKSAGSQLGDKYHIACSAFDTALPDVWNQSPTKYHNFVGFVYHCVLLREDTPYISTTQETRHFSVASS